MLTESAVLGSLLPHSPIQVYAEIFPYCVFRLCGELVIIILQLPISNTFLIFQVSTGAVVMAYIATALQNYENLFNILVMASLTIIVGYAIPVTAKKVKLKNKIVGVEV